MIFKSIIFRTCNQKFDISDLVEVDVVSRNRDIKIYLRKPKIGDDICIDVYSPFIKFDMHLEVQGFIMNKEKYHFDLFEAWIMPANLIVERK
jgi:hypothetical protein